jgi:surface antigen
MRLRILVTTLLATLSLAACGRSNGDVNKSDVGLGTGAVLGGVLGNQFGKGSGRIVGTMAGVVVGGIVGHDIGRQLDQRDRMFAQQAEMDAWERGQSGRPVKWRNPENGRYGEIVPMQPYRRGSNDCRDYTHTIYIDGRPQAMRGTACRNPDGTWSNVG